MKTVARVVITLVIVAAGCIGGYELWDYYMLSPWARDIRVQADVVSIAPDVSGFVDELRVKDNQFVHKGDVLFMLDRERYSRALFTAETVVAARRAEMDMRQHEAARHARLTTLAISDEARENSSLTANSTAASYQQALADRSTAQLNLDRTIVRAPVNGFVTNLTLDVGQFASVSTKVVALIDSDSHRGTGYFEETKIPVVKRSGHVDIFLMTGGPPLWSCRERQSRHNRPRQSCRPELLANLNPTFEWVRLAQRLPVRIHIDQIPEGVLISSGVTCTAVVEAPVRQWAVLVALRESEVAGR